MAQDGETMTRKRRKESTRAKSRRKSSAKTLDGQEAFYASHDFGDLFDSGEDVEPNPTASGRLRGRKPLATTARGPREMRLLVPLDLSEQVRSAAVSEGRSVSGWLLKLVKQKLMTESGRVWSFEPGQTAPVIDKDGTRSAAFIHVTVSNLGEFSPRVRGWLRFCDLDGRDLCEGEMPIRWSSKPEPLMLVPVPTSPNQVAYQLVPNPALLPDGYVTDFAAGEEQEFAFAIKMRDGTCWGWTQESYWHGWRHPRWKLPAGKIRACVRLMAGGKEQRADFELDTSESIDSIVVRATEGHAGVQGKAASAHLPSEDLPENVVELFRRTQK
jgi:hypothetical protein